MSGSAKILVIRGGAIGDFILTLPVLAALRAQFPAARVEVLGYSHIAQLAQAGGHADAVRSIEAATLAPFFARNGDLPLAMHDYLAGFALIISFLYDPDEIFRENVRRCTACQFIQGPHRPDERGERHATDVFLEPLQRLAIFGADPVPRLDLPGIVPAGTLAFHPGSGSERKNWPERSWAELLQGLATETLPQADGGSSPAPWLLIGGEAEGSRLERLARGLARPVELVLNQPLPEVARRLAACRFFLGHDSGITHLAAAVGLPGVVLWGETAERVWRPRSDRMQLVQAGAGLSSLPVEQVKDTFTRTLRDVGPLGSGRDSGKL